MRFITSLFFASSLLVGVQCNLSEFLNSAGVTLDASYSSEPAPSSSVYSSPFTSTLTHASSTLKAASKHHADNVEPKQTQADEFHDKLQEHDLHVQTHKLDVELDAMFPAAPIFRALKPKGEDLEAALRGFTLQYGAFEKEADKFTNFKQKFGVSKEALEKAILDHAGVHSELSDLHNRLALADDLLKTTAADIGRATSKKGKLEQVASKLQGSINTVDLDLTKLASRISSVEASIALYKKELTQCKNGASWLADYELKAKFERAEEAYNKAKAELANLIKIEELHANNERQKKAVDLWRLLLQEFSEPTEVNGSSYVAVLARARKQLADFEANYEHLMKTQVSDLPVTVTDTTSLDVYIQQAGRALALQREIAKAEFSAQQLIVSAIEAFGKDVTKDEVPLEIIRKRYNEACDELKRTEKALYSHTQLNDELKQKLKAFETAYLSAKSNYEKTCVYLALISNITPIDEAEGWEAAIRAAIADLEAQKAELKRREDELAKARALRKVKVSDLTQPAEHLAQADELYGEKLKTDTAKHNARLVEIEAGASPLTPTLSYDYFAGNHLNLDEYITSLEGKVERQKKRVAAAALKLSAYQACLTKASSIQVCTDAASKKLLEAEQLLAQLKLQQATLFATKDQLERDLESVRAVIKQLKEEIEKLKLVNSAREEEHKPLHSQIQSTAKVLLARNDKSHNEAKAIVSSITSGSGQLSNVASAVSALRDRRAAVLAAHEALVAVFEQQISAIDALIDDVDCKTKSEQLTQQQRDQQAQARALAAQQDALLAQQAKALADQQAQFQQAQQQHQQQAQQEQLAQQAAAQRAAQLAFQQQQQQAQAQAQARQQAPQPVR